MAKKVKCIECMESINIALPYRITKENVDYAKQCLVIAKRSIVCGRTMKTKTREHEQYCKHFAKSIFINDITEEIEQLEAKIKEYEALEEMGEIV